MNATRSDFSRESNPPNRTRWHRVLGFAAFLTLSFGVLTLRTPTQSQTQIARPLPTLAKERLFPLKEVTEAADPRALQHVQVKLVGRFSGQPILLKDRDMSGRKGYFVVEPLVEKGDTGLAILVLRGWLAADTPKLEQMVSTPKHELVIEGRLATPSLGDEVKAASEKGLIRQNLSLQHYARETGATLVPMVVLQEPGNSWSEQDIRQDPLKRRWNELYSQDKDTARKGWAMITLGGVMAAIALWLRPRHARA